MAISSIDVNSLRGQVRHYVERCRLDDGGYFFARIPPSSAMDTYFAVKSLYILGLQPEHPAATKRFFLNALKKGFLLSSNGMFAATEVLGDLGYSVHLPPRYLDRLNLLKNSMGGFGIVYNLDIEVVSELETTYRVLKTMGRLGMGYDDSQVVGFVLKFQNEDGGFGRGGISTLASTFYATGIFNLVGFHGDERALTLKYLRGKESVWQLNFIEDIYWISNSLVSLGQKPILADWMISFVSGCQRGNGGFARKDVMGIPSLEYTYYAVSIFKALSCL
jgi:hypothetical protein